MVVVLKVENFMKYFRLLIAVSFVTYLSCAHAFDIPFFSKKYATIEECKKFIPKVTNQDLFVNRVCDNLFDANKKLSDKVKERLLCLRNGINSATSISQSRKVIFDCFEKMPSSNPNNALYIAQLFFKTPDELASEQLIYESKQRQLPPLGMNCIIIGNMIDCM